MSENFPQTAPCRNDGKVTRQPAESAGFSRKWVCLALDGMVYPTLVDYQSGSDCERTYLLPNMETYRYSVDLEIFKVSQMSSRLTDLSQ